MNQNLLNVHTDPDIVGPGIWHSIHLLGKNANMIERKKAFIYFMDLLYHNFPCPVCKTHIQQYMNKNPIVPFLNLKSPNGTDIGLFKWSWIFHNAVNTRLGKPEMDWDTVQALYNHITGNNQNNPLLGANGVCLNCGQNKAKSSGVKLVGK